MRNTAENLPPNPIFRGYNLPKMLGMRRFRAPKQQLCMRFFDCLTVLPKITILISGICAAKQHRSTAPVL